jgi:hypothetical protein
MGGIFLYVTTKIFLAIRGGPYMTPIIKYIALNFTLTPIIFDPNYSIYFDPNYFSDPNYFEVTFPPYVLHG